METRCYSELIQLQTFEERYRYLRLKGNVGADTFGFDRCDLGIVGREIFGKVVIHHMNPIRKEDLEHMTEYLLNPEFLITTTHETHNAIHYGDENLLMKDPVERTPYDTCPWKRGAVPGMVNFNRDNSFYKNRHTIFAISRVRKTDIREASEFWAADHYLSNSPEKFEWFGILDLFSEKGQLDKLFD